MIELNHEGGEEVQYRFPVWKYMIDSVAFSHSKTRFGMEAIEEFEVVILKPNYAYRFELRYAPAYHNADHWFLDFQTPHKLLELFNEKGKKHLLIEMGGYL